MIAFVPSPALFSSRSKLQLSNRKYSSCASPRRSPTAELSTVLVIGANRGLGLQVASVLHDKAIPRLVTTRRQESFCPPTLGALSSAVHVLDAMDRETAHTLLENVAPDVVISCIGGSVPHGIYPDFKGNRNLIDAATAANVKRFVLISALGAGDSESSVPFQVMDTMRPLLLEKSHAEVYLRKSNIKWTIIRPGPMVEGPTTGTAVATEGTKCYGTITREDLAALVIKAAESEKAVGKTLHIVDAKKILITSPYVRPLEFWEPLPFDEFEL